MLGGALIATPLAACAQDNSAPYDSTPQPVAMVVDGSANITGDIPSAQAAKVHQVAAVDAPATPIQTVSIEAEKPPVPTVPMSERMETSESGARLVAATSSKNGIVFLVYGNNQWLIDELSHAIYAGHQKGHAVKGIALGSSTAPDGFDVYVHGHRIAEARDVLNTDVRRGATYAIEYGQKLLDTKFSEPTVQSTASLNP